MEQCGRVVSFVSIIAVAMSSHVEVPMMVLNNGRCMPAIALGTYIGYNLNNSATSTETTHFRDIIAQAIIIGYRHFDTATIYNTEREIGYGIKAKMADGVVSREELFLTTKLWSTNHRREQVPSALRASLSQLGTNYVDLYLMHWPMGLNDDYTFSDVDFMETWQGLEDVVNLGLAKAIGVSNFNMEQLKRVLEEGSIKPAVIEIELHLQNAQEELVSYAQSQGLVVMGYSPFGSLVSRYGTTFPGPKIDDPTLSAIAKKYGKTTPQVVLRWLVERQIVPIPKTVNPRRLQENIDIFDFTLEKDEIEKISRFDSSTRFTLPSFWQNHPYYPFEKVPNPVSFTHFKSLLK